MSRLDLSFPVKMVVQLISDLASLQHATFVKQLSTEDIHRSQLQLTNFKVLHKTELVVQVTQRKTSCACVAVATICACVTAIFNV